MYNMQEIKYTYLKCPGPWVNAEVLYILGSPHIVPILSPFAGPFLYILGGH